MTIWAIIASVKVRIGVAVGALPLDDFAAVVDDLDALGFDSIWLPESFQRGGVDPLVGLAFAAARDRPAQARHPPRRARAATRTCWRASWPSSTSSRADGCC